MKRRFSPFWIGFVLILVFSPIMWYNYEQRSAIRRVLSQQRNAYASADHFYGFSNSAYLEKLKKIDFGWCPRDFREAWLCYVQTWERVASPSAAAKSEEKLLSGATKYAGGIQVGSGQGGLNGSLEYANRDKAAQFYETKDTKVALQRCQTIAVGFGINLDEFPPN